MENRKSLKLLIVISAFVFTLSIAPSAFAYEVETHAYLTDEVINFYNQNYPNNPIKDEFKSYIIDGSRREDDAPRWTNHFYDPVNNLGLNDPRWGSGFSSKEWAQSDSKQTTFINRPIKYVASMLTVSEQENIKDMDVNFTWQQAVRYYRDGKIEKAMFVLGHVLHLIEDASVPDHTRNDGHPEPLGDGSPYEIFSSKFSLKNPDTNLTTRLVNKKPFDNMPVLSNYFDEMAKYSNNNFYSKDTINKIYNLPVPDGEKLIGRYKFSFKKENSIEYLLLRLSSIDLETGKQELATIDNDKILIDYWSHLSTKSVQVAAGVINLFFNDIARVDYGDAKPINDDRNPISWTIDNARAFGQITSSFGRAITSSVANTVSAFSAQVIEAAKGLFSNVADVVQDNAQIPDQNLLAEISLDENNSMAQPSEQKPIGPNLVARSVKNNDAAATAISQLSYGPDKSNETAKSNVKKATAEEKPKVGETTEAAKTSLNQANEQKIDKKTSSSTQDQLLNTPAQSDNFQKQNTQSLSTVAQICSFQTSKIPTYQKLLINELAWMGSVKNSSDEWIELKNISGTELNISNWQVLDKEEQIKITFPENTKVSAGGFLLLERTDDNSAPNVKADIIYTGALSNSNEALRLFDDKCGLVDEVFANSEWSAGDAPTKRTMERQTDLTWWTYNGAGEGSGDVLILGTPKKENMVKVVYYGGGGGGSVATAAVVVETANNSNTQPSKLLISEVQITGGTGKTDNDFVEIYNPNDTSVNLKGYRLVKRTKTGTTDTSIKSWTDDAYIESKGYYLWANSDYKDISILPNATTSASLANDNGVALRFGAEDTGTIIDSVAWGAAENVFIGAGVFSQNPGAGQSIQRKFQDNTFIDTENNAADFEIQTCPSPKAQSKSCAVSETNKSNQAPSAFFDLSTTTPKIGETVIFNAASSTDADGNIALYDWNFGDNQLASSTQATTTHSYLLTGNYSISLTVFDNLNATSTIFKTIIVSANIVSNQAPIAVFNFLPAEPKTNEAIIFNAASSTDPDGNIVLYDWDFGDNQLASSTQATTTHSYLLAGNYNISLTVFDNLNATSTYTLPLSVASSTIQQDEELGYILISEIMPGAGEGKSDEEFVELYNPNNTTIDLTGYSLRKKTSAVAASSTPLVSAVKFLGKIISAKSFLLIASPNYPASSTADLVYSSASYGLANNNDQTVLLLNSAGETADEVYYISII
ncbi:MAG: lamin tail domain-containing protein [Patescibacteria group bacterium]